jgi:hypothetical protein
MIIWMAHQSNADEVCMKIDSIVPYMATDMITEGFRIFSIICTISGKRIKLRCEDMQP